MIRFVDEKQNHLNDVYGEKISFKDIYNEKYYPEDLENLLYFLRVNIRSKSSSSNQISMGK